MKKGVNPLNVFNVRQVNYCPSHFETVVLEKTYNIDEAICDWISENCTGRFFIGTAVDLDNDHKISSKLKVGFENSKEVSYFMLACPLLKYK